MLSGSATKIVERAPPVAVAHRCIELDGERGAVEAEVARARQVVDARHQVVGGGIRRLARRLVTG